MKKLKRRFIKIGDWLYILTFLILPIFGLYYMFKSLTNFLTGIIIILAIIVYDLWLKTKTIEMRLQNDFAYKNLSYQFSILIEPKWGKILPEKFPNTFKTEADFNEFFETNKNKVIQRCFSFKAFYDGISGLEQIWSDTHKTFLTHLFVCCHIDENSFNLYQENKDWGGYIQISPSGISGDESKSLLEFIPFYKILNFFEITYLKNHCNYDLKSSIEFPIEIQQQLKKNNISHKYHKEFDSHIFENDYFYICFDIEFFENKHIKIKEDL